MKLVVEPSASLSGSVPLLPSKFGTQVSLAVAALSGKKCTIKKPLKVKDTLPMLKAIENFGGEVKRSKDRWSVEALPEIKPSTGSVDAKNSASALALLAGVLSVSKSSVVLNGDSRLRSRPMPSLLSVMRKFGVDIYSTKRDDAPPFIIFGGMVAGGEMKVSKRELRYLPALLPPAPLLKKKIVLKLPAAGTGLLTEMVEDVMSSAGVDVIRGEKSIEITPKRYRSFVYEVQQELAGSAPLVLAPLLSGTGLKLKFGKIYSRDAAFLKTLGSFGIGHKKTAKSLSMWGQRLRGASVDISWAPELLPFFAVLACAARGRTHIHGAGEARNMKSDRISAMASELKKIGAKVLEQSGGLVIQGPTTFDGGEVDGHGDYAVTAALALAALSAREKVVITNGPEALKTSYPHFLTTFRGMGVKIGYQT